MRNLFIYLCSSLVFIACQKGNDELLISKETDLNSKALMSLETPTARRNSFIDLLKPKEKVEFVSNRLLSVIAELQLNEEQISIINDLKKFLKPDVYIENSELNKQMLAYEPTWRKKAIQVLTKDQLRYIFSFNTKAEFQKKLAKSEIKTAASAGGEGADDCDCATKSEYCWNDCVLSHCVFATYACGTLYLYDCDGLCN